MKKTMLKAVTLTATAAMLMGTLSFTATGVLAGEKYPAIATYNELGTAQVDIYDELEALTSENNVSEEVQTDTQDLETITPDVPKNDTANTHKSGKWVTCDWNISDDGVLTISGGVGAGTERIKDGNSYISTAPWYTKYDNDKIKKINIEGRITFPEQTKLGGLFLDCKNAEEINGLENLDTTNVTSMAYMFGNCNGLTNISVDKFNTSGVTDMSGMFSLYNINHRTPRKLTNLDLSSFDTSNVTNMNNMFSYCHSLTTLDLGNFDTSNVTNMSYMFAECSNLTYLNVSSFNTAKVTNMSRMFGDTYANYGCSSLTNLDLSSFNTSNVTDMAHMFSNL